MGARRTELKRAAQADAAVQDYQKALAHQSGLALGVEGFEAAWGRCRRLLKSATCRALASASGASCRAGRRFIAASADYPELRIPLEMMGEGKPKLLAWELRDAPHKGYGVLRFAGGKVPGKSGPEDTELAAIIDIENGRVLAIQPHRQGARVAAWTWEDDRVQIASVDGVTDEFAVRSLKPPAAATAAAPCSARAAVSARRAEICRLGAVGSADGRSRKAITRPQRRASQHNPSPRRCSICCSTRPLSAACSALRLTLPLAVRGR